MGNPAVFLDRDGTLIEDRHYLKDPDQISFLPFAIEGVKLMQEKGYLLFVVSNQSGVARQLIGHDEFWAVHYQLIELLLAQLVNIREFAYCLHHPDDGCHCRKPKPGLVQDLARKYDIDLSKSAVVGDKESDCLLAKAVGARAYVVRAGRDADTELTSSEFVVCNHLLEVAVSLPVY